MTTPQDQAQRDQARDIRRHVIVRAPAGSGKTELLVQRGLAALAVASQPEAVLCITFTVKAANEIRQRLTRALDAAQAPPPAAAHARATYDLAVRVVERDQQMGWGLLDNPARIQAMTIDALCSRIVRQFPLLSGMGGSVETLDNPDPAYEQAVLNLFGEYESDQLDSEVREAMTRVLTFADNQMDQLLPLFVSMLVQREQWRDMMGEGVDAVAAEAILDATITDRIAALAACLPSEAATLLDLARTVGGDKLAWAHSSLSLDAPGIDDLAAMQGLARLLLKVDGDWRASLTAREGFPAKDSCTADARACLESISSHSEAETIRQRLIAVLRLPGAGYPEHALELSQSLALLLRRSVAHLMLAFHEAGGVDFSEIAIRAVNALASDDMSVLSSQDAQFEHLLVDEYQDTSTLQNELIGALVSGWAPEDGRSLFLVGDPQQSIYGFRQAEVREFMNIWETGVFADLSLERLSLTQNFRSRPAVVAGINQIMAAGFPVESDRDNGVVALSRAVAARDPEAGAGVFMHRVDHDDWTDEAEHVAELVTQRLAEDEQADIAILARAKNHVRLIVDALDRRDIQHASQDLYSLTRGGPAADAIALIRALWHAMDRGAWITLLRSPLVGLYHADLIALTSNALAAPVPELLRQPEAVSAMSADGRQRVARLLAVLDATRTDFHRACALDQVALSVWHGLDGPRCVDAAGHDAVNKVFETLSSHCVGGQIDSLARFEASLSRLFANTSSGRVQVMTIHKAKGLEFDTVFLVGAGRVTLSPDRPLLHRLRTRHGVLTVPRAPRRTDKADPAAQLYEFSHQLANEAMKNEAMRLAYVAMTRAKSRLHVMINVKTDSPTGSSFLAPLWDALCGYEVARKAPVSASALDDAYIPCPARLPADHERTATRASLHAPTLSAYAPSAKAFSDDGQRSDSGETNAYERIAGTLFHRTQETLLLRADWANLEPQALIGPLRSMARGQGLPEPDVARCAQRVADLFALTQRCSRLRDLLAQAEAVRTEYAYAGATPKGWVNGIIDLVIWTPDAIWTIDTKSSDGAGQGASADQMAAILRLRYREQVSEYASAIQALHPTRRVRTALFLPAYSRLEEITVPGRSPQAA